MNYKQLIGNRLRNLIRLIHHTIHQPVKEDKLVLAQVTEGHDKRYDIVHQLTEVLLRTWFSHVTGDEGVFHWV